MWFGPPPEGVPQWQAAAQTEHAWKPRLPGVKKGSAPLLRADAITAARCLPLFFQSWWLSLKLASAHVSHEVMKARKIIDKISPTSDEWDTQVVPKALELIDVILPALSNGWADGLLALWLGCWIFALGSSPLSSDLLDRWASW